MTNKLIYLPHQARGPEPEPAPAPKRQKRHAGDEEAYERLLKMETERAVKQTELAKRQIKLTLLQQKETELTIKLLEKQLDIWNGMVLSGHIIFCWNKTLFGPCIPLSFSVLVHASYNVWWTRIWEIIVILFTAVLQCGQKFYYALHFLILLKLLVRSTTLTLKCNKHLE